MPLSPILIGPLATLATRLGRPNAFAPDRSFLNAKPTSDFPIPNWPPVRRLLPEWTKAPFRKAGALDADASVF